MARRFETLTAVELEELERGRTLFLFPVGAMEDRGPHLPLGLAALEAEAVCERLAARLESDMEGWQAVIMPRAPIGVQAAAPRIRIISRGHVLRDYLVDSCRALGNLGFWHFACVAGNLAPRQVTAIEEAGRLLRGRGVIKRVFRFFKGGPPPPSLASLSSALVEKETVLASPLWPDLAEHGGARDTSVALALGLARDSWQSLAPVERPHSRWLRLKSRWQLAGGGYWGKPAAATREAGESALSAQVEGVFARLRAVLGGNYSNRVFSSSYWFFPPNRSFFAAWVISLSLGLLMIVWAFVTFMMLVQPD